MPDNEINQGLLDNVVWKYLQKFLHKYDFFMAIYKKRYIFVSFWFVEGLVLLSPPLRLLYDCIFQANS